VDAAGIGDVDGLVQIVSAARNVRSGNALVVNSPTVPQAEEQRI
jgi:tRNA-binding EMAP/Myf-like protein